jgi:hypothetical protein
MRGKCDPVRTVHYLSDLAEVVLLSALRESSPLFDRPINFLEVSEPRTFVIWKGSILSKDEIIRNWFSLSNSVNLKFYQLLHNHPE